MTGKGRRERERREGGEERGGRVGGEGGAGEWEGERGGREGGKGGRDIMNSIDPLNLVGLRRQSDRQHYVISRH